MWPFRKRAELPLGRLEEVESQLAELRAVTATRFDGLEKALGTTNSLVIDTQQDHRKLLRSFMELQVDMTGLAAKMTNTLRQMTARAAKLKPPGTDLEGTELTDADEGDDAAVEAIARRMKGR